MGDILEGRYECTCSAIFRNRKGLDFHLAEIQVDTLTPSWDKSNFPRSRRLTTLLSLRSALPTREATMMDIFVMVAV